MYRRNRGFNVAEGFKKAGIELPVQSTKTSAGYDFEAAEDAVIPSLWIQLLKNVQGFRISDLDTTSDEERARLFKLIKPTLVSTGIKAYMNDDEFLALYNRSSNPMKKLLIMSNGTGIVDSDYYENPDNDGHIMFQFLNFGIFPVTIKKGDKIGQGIFQPYLKADEGKARVLGEERVGGFGSTTKNEPKFYVGDAVFMTNHPYTFTHSYGIIDSIDFLPKGEFVYLVRPHQYPTRDTFKFRENQLSKAGK